VVPVLNDHSLDQIIDTIPHLAQGRRPVRMNYSLPALPSPVGAALTSCVRLGIQVVVAVNKMDHHQVRWADTQFNQVVNRVTDSFKPRFQAFPLRMSFVPISATEKLNLYDVRTRDTASHEQWLGQLC
jgi:hypothetical protein